MVCLAMTDSLPQDVRYKSRHGFCPSSPGPLPLHQSELSHPPRRVRKMASKERLKSESDLQSPAASNAPRRFTRMNKLYLFFVVAGLSVFELWHHGVPARLTTPLIEHDKPGSSGQLVRSYNLQIGQRWMNQGSRYSSRYLTDWD